MTIGRFVNIFLNKQDFNVKIKSKSFSKSPIRLGIIENKKNHTFKMWFLWAHHQSGDLVSRLRCSQLLAKKNQNRTNSILTN